MLCVELTGVRLCECKLGLRQEGSRDRDEASCRWLVGWLVLLFLQWEGAALAHFPHELQPNSNKKIIGRSLGFVAGWAWNARARAAGMGSCCLPLWKPTEEGAAFARLPGWEAHKFEAGRAAGQCCSRWVLVGVLAAAQAAASSDSDKARQGQVPAQSTLARRKEEDGKGGPRE